MLSAGLTGTVASGKSEALARFKALGAATLSSDAIVKDLMKPGSSAARRVRAHFGPRAIRAGGAVCREYLRERVLADPRELDWLERALHPGVRKAIRAFLAKHRRAAGTAVVEVPLLFENGFDRLFDRTVMVRTPAAATELRAAKRGMSPELYHFLSERQWSAARKAEAADLIINNTGSLRQLETRVAAVYRKLLSLSSGSSASVTDALRSASRRPRRARAEARPSRDRVRTKLKR